MRSQMDTELVGSKMPTRVFLFYKRYLAQDTRSLASLSQDEESPSIATLKRWSVRYDWTNLAAVHDELLAQRMSDQFMRILGAVKYSELGPLPTAKLAFYKRIDRDLRKALARGKDPVQTLQIDVRDFIRLVRLERELSSQ